MKRKAAAAAAPAPVSVFAPFKLRGKGWNDGASAEFVFEPTPMLKLTLDFPAATISKLADAIVELHAWRAALGPYECKSREIDAGDSIYVTTIGGWFEPKLTVHFKLSQEYEDAREAPKEFGPWARTALAVSFYPSQAHAAVAELRAAIDTAGKERAYYEQLYAMYRCNGDPGDEHAEPRIRNPRRAAA